MERRTRGWRARLTAAAVAALVGLVGTALVPAGAAGATPVLSLAESRADELVRMVDADPGAFGGVSLDEKSGTLTVRYVAKAGPAAALARLSPLTVRGAQRAQQSWQVQLVPVAHSTKELEAVRDRIVADPDWREAAGDTLSSSYVDIRNNRVAIGLTTVTPTIEAATDKLSGGLATLHVAARPDRTATRLDDFEPWAVGSRIIVSGGCTSGFIIRNATTPTLRRMVTAGHCGPTGTTVTNNGDTVGSVVSRNFTEDGLDVEYIGGRTYEPWTYTGPPTSSTGQFIRGTRISLVGRSYCTNGVSSGEVCSGTVQEIDICQTFSDGVTTCQLDRMTSTGATLSLPGDSGGNIFFTDSVGLKIGGIIIGGSGTTAYFHSYHHLIPSGWVFDTA